MDYFGSEVDLLRKEKICSWCFFHYLQVVDNVITEDPNHTLFHRSSRSIIVTHEGTCGMAAGQPMHVNPAKVTVAVSAESHGRSDKNHKSQTITITPLIIEAFARQNLGTGSFPSHT